MGRKSLLNDNTKDIILRYISNGNYIRTACLAAGISEHTFYNWERRGNNPGNGNDIYVEFFQALKIAEAKSEADTVSRVHDAGEDKRNWAADMTRLERKNPERWGRRLELEVGPSKILIALREEAQELTGIKQIATQTIEEID